MLRIAVTYGGDVRRLNLAAGSVATVGASPDNDLVAPFPGVSRRHARIEVERAEAVLIDLGSKNGLVVDGERRDRVALLPGDRVVVGRAVLAVDDVPLSDLELAVTLEPEGAAEGLAASREARSGETAPHWALHLVRDLESLSVGASESRRTAVLARIADSVGATGLWSFAVVEGDLFLRDCVGAVPSDTAVARIGETILQEGAVPPLRPVELEDPSGWTLICPPVAGAAPVVVTLHPPGRRPEPWAADLLVHLAERLRLVEGELSSEDLPALVGLFLAQAAARYGKRIEGVGRRALELLQTHHWDGRLHELEHAIEGAVLRCPEGGAVEASHLRELVTRSTEALDDGSALRATTPDDTLVTTAFLPLRARLDETERTAIREALELTAGDHGRAARLLRISRESLARRIARLDLDLDRG